MTKIVIMYSEVLLDLQNKNREEVRFIQEPQARYLAEAGTDKMEEVRRSIHEAFSHARTLYARFISPDISEEATDAEITKEDVELVLEVTERRIAGKARMIADSLHSFIVNLALSKFYNTINQADLATKRQGLATAEVQLLNKLLFEKLPPVYPESYEETSNHNHI